MIIDDELREEAAIYCSCMASWFCSDIGPCAFPKMEFSGDAMNIADILVKLPRRRKTYGPDHFEHVASCYAEAEAKLRTGWTP